MLDEAALAEHRPTLVGVCYRMLGCPFAAQDVAQEALDRAWRSRDSYDPDRASVRTWLYRIATNACIDELRRARRRALPADLGGPSGPDGDLGRPLAESAWVTPAPTALVAGDPGDPGERVVRDESIRLAFVAALQRLTPVERAVLILRRVLGWPAGEVAECLERSTASVNSALQRARTKLDRDGGPPTEVHAPGDPVQSELLERYVRAFEAYDVATLTALLHREATMSMPPFPWWIRGAEHIEQALRGSEGFCRGSRMVPVSCNDLPAYGQYLPRGPGGALVPWALVLVETDGGLIRSLTSYLQPERLFALAGLPPELSAAQ